MMNMAIPLVVNANITLPLKDTMEPQILKFDSPIDLYNMKIIIKSVYPGAKYKDTAISEISFR